MVTRSDRTIPRLYHNVQSLEAIYQLQRDLKDAYGREVVPLRHDHPFDVTILSRKAVKLAWMTVSEQRQKAERSVVALDAVLTFDETSTCRALARRLFVWKPAGSTTSIVTTPVLTPLFKEEFITATSAIDDAFGTELAWRKPIFDVALATVDNPALISAIHNAALPGKRELKFGPLQMRPTEVEQQLYRYDSQP